MNKYDAVIIGAGMGGLAAAAVLSKAKKKVLVLEKSHIPGGFATSFKRGRFDFEVSLHELCGFGRYDKPFGGVRQLFDYLQISDKIEWVDIPEAYRLITYETKPKIDVTMPFGIENYINKMESYVPGSKKCTESFFKLGSDYLSALSELYKATSNKEKLSVLLNNRDFFHTCSLSVNDVIKELGFSEKAAAIIKGYWAYLCADCDNLSFFLYLSMVNSYIELKSVIPKSRSLEISLAFCNSIEENGGRILLNTEATEIITENGKAVGVMSANGSKYSAENVICDVSPHIVFDKLIDKNKIDIYDIKKTNARQFGGRGFCVYLGLNKSAKELGLNEYSYFIYPDMDTVKQFKLMGSIDTNNVQNTVCINAAYPDASPKGTCILEMTTLFTTDVWSSVSDKDYFNKKNQFAKKMINNFEKATGIKISDCIEEIEIASPQTFAHFTGTPQGAIYGYLGSKWDGLFARQLMDKPYSKIGNLEFVGGYGNKLNGYSSAMSTGFDTTKFLLKK